MIKRYDIFEESFGYTSCRIDITENNHDGDCGGEWVRYDDIKNLIPDNRVTRMEFRDLFSVLDGHHYVLVMEIFIQKGWIKPEVET